MSNLKNKMRDATVISQNSNSAALLFGYLFASKGQLRDLIFSWFFEDRFLKCTARAGIFYRTSWTDC